MSSYSSLCIYWKWPARYHRIQVALVLASCFLVHLSIGSIYTYGNLVPYIVSYVREKSHPDNLRSTDTPYVYACQIAGQGCSMVVGGILEKKFGPRVVTLAGGLLMSGGVALTYFSIQYSFWLMLLTYGVMFGLGTGLAYVGPLACAMKWLPKWKGLACGVVVSGFGLSALVFNSVQTEYINPHNSAPDLQDQDNPDVKYFSQSEILDRVPYVFLILSACYVTMQVIGCIMIVNPASNTKDIDLSISKRHEDGSFEISKSVLYKSINSNTCNSSLVDSTSLKGSDYEKPLDDGDSDEIDKDGVLETDKLLSSHSLSRSLSCNNSISSVDGVRAVTKITSDYYIYNLSPRQMVCKPNFYFLWFMFFFSGTAVTFISSLYKSFGLEKISDDDRFLSLVGGVSAIFNLFGRLGWGAIADAVTYKFALVVQGATMTVLLLTLYSTAALGKAAFFLWVCGIYFCVGGYFSLFPAATARSFGQDNISINYGIVFSSQTAGGLLAGLISQLLVDHIHWYGMFFFIGGLSGLEFILALIYRHKRYLLLPTPGDLMNNVSRIEEATIKFPDNASLDLPD